jgi:cytoskeletal protein RodZ
MSRNGSKTNVAKWMDLPVHRTNKGISLREIADSTKISIRFLQAIEEGDFEQLPGGIYNTSYLRQYAREIGYEESKLIERYQETVTTLS